MPPRPPIRIRPRRGRAIATLAISALLGTSCVSEHGALAPDDAPAVDAQAVVVPFAASRSAGWAAVDRYYESVLQQMQEATDERDLARLDTLLETHQRSDAPSWARAAMLRFRDAAAGLWFETFLAQHARIEARQPTGSLAEPLDMQLRIAGKLERHALTGTPGGNPVGFVVRATVRDHDVVGGTSEVRSSLRLDMPAVADLAAGVTLPFRIDLRPSSAVEREVEVAIELLPGAVEVDGAAAPVHRTAVASWSTTLYPPGVDPVREQPLRTLSHALRGNDTQHLPHIFLSAVFMPDRDHEAATELLMRSVRLGPPEQARVAMAALQRMTGADVPVGDRTAWLQWWQMRAERDQ